MVIFYSLIIQTVFHTLSMIQCKYEFSPTDARNKRNHKLQYFFTTLKAGIKGYCLPSIFRKAKLLSHRYCALIWGNYSLYKKRSK